VSRGFHGYVVGCASFAGVSGRLARFEAGAPTDAVPVCLTSSSETGELHGTLNPTTGVQLYLGSTQESFLADRYEVSVLTGTYDLVVADAHSARVVVRRGEVVAAGERTLDLDLANFPGASPTAIGVVPSDQRITGDRVVGIVSEGVGTRQRTVQHVVGGSGFAPFALPTDSRLALDRAGAHTSDAWEYGSFALRSASPGPGGTPLHMLVARTWLWAAGNSGDVPWVEVSTLPGSTATTIGVGEPVRWTAYASSGAYDDELTSLSDSGTFAW